MGRAAIRIRCAAGRSWIRDVPLSRLRERVATIKDASRVRVFGKALRCPHPVSCASLSRPTSPASGRGKVTERCAAASRTRNIPCALQCRIVYARPSSPLAKPEPAGIMYISNETEPCDVRLSHPCRQWPDTIPTARSLPRPSTSIMPKAAKRFPDDMMLKRS